MTKRELISAVALMGIVFIMVTAICIVTNAPATDATDILTEPTETIHIEETEPVPEVTEAPVTDEIEEPEPEPIYPEFDISVHEDGEYGDLYLLALVIYQEAGGNGSCDDCRRRVADVVLNRVTHSKFPDTIKDNLLRKKQYGRLYWTGIRWPDRAKKDGEKKAVERAYRIAQEVLDGQHSDVYGKGYIWQAEFKQGKSGFWCCGHYFGKS